MIAGSAGAELQDRCPTIFFMLRMKCQELLRFAQNSLPFGLRTGLLTY